MTRLAGRAARDQPPLDQTAGACDLVDARGLPCHRICDGVGDAERTLAVGIGKSSGRDSPERPRIGVSPWLSRCFVSAVAYSRPIEFNCRAVSFRFSDTQALPSLDWIVQTVRG